MRRRSTPSAGSARPCADWRSRWNRVVAIRPARGTSTWRRRRCSSRHASSTQISIARRLNAAGRAHTLLRGSSSRGLLCPTRALAGTTATGGLGGRPGSGLLGCLLLAGSAARTAVGFAGATRHLRGLCRLPTTSRLVGRCGGVFSANGARRRRAQRQQTDHDERSPQYGHHLVLSGRFRVWRSGCRASRVPA